MIDCRFGVWADKCQVPFAGRRFTRDAEGRTDEVAGFSVVSSLADAGRIEELLAAGAEQVLLGESALQDAELVAEAVARHGGERIGIWLPVRRAVVSWGLDSDSNADFNIVSVTNPVPRWVVLLADHTSSDVDALWWSKQMIAAGCSTVLVSVEDPADDDLLPCAEMAETASEHFWLDPGSADAQELRFWVRYGQARQLVLPAFCDADAVRTELQQRLAHDKGFSCAG